MAGTSTILLKNGTVLSHDDTDTRVIVLWNTDVLIEGNKVAEIGRDITLPSASSPATTVIDCTDKIVSPGFIDTHHHLWQTQLKGRHVDETLLDYFTSGNIQQNHYTGKDLFWGQLAGALEAIDGGTTFVLDHAQCCVDEERTNQALSATITSGIRSVFSFTRPMVTTEKWDLNELVPKGANQGNIDLGLDQVEQLASKQPYADGRVEVGLAFDLWFLPEQMIKDTFARAVRAGVRVATSHIVGFGWQTSHGSTIQKISSCDLLAARRPHLVLSHCTNLPPEDLSLLATSQAAISCTPETEAQMVHGHPALLFPDLNVSLGVDCHSNNTAFMPQIARTGLLCARLTRNHELLAQGKYPLMLPGDSEMAFNAMTMAGARAVGLENAIGSLREGKLADVVVFNAAGSLGMTCVADTDPVAAVVRFSNPGDVDCVIVDGVVRKVDGRVCPVKRVTVGETEEREEVLLQWHEIRKELVKSMKNIWKKDEMCSREAAKRLIYQIMGVKSERFVDQ